MKKGACPRCGGKEIYSGSTALDNFVCGECGYVESYIAKEKDLATIKKKWPLVF